MTLRAALLEYCAAAPDAIAVRGAHREAEVLTRRELLARATRAAHALADAGVRAADRVLIALPTQPSFPVWFWATQLLGAVAVPIPPVVSERRKAAQLEYLRKIEWLARPRALVRTAASLLAADEVRGMRCLLDTGLPDAGSLPAAAVGDADCALIQFSSGSTGQPKGCVLSNAAVRENARAFAQVFGYRPHDSTFNWMPLFHDFGLMVGVLAPVVAGLTSVLLRTESFMVDPGAWIRGMSGAGPMHTAGPMSAFALAHHRVAGAGAERAHDLRDVRSIICAAEPIYPDVAGEFLEFFGASGLRREAFFSGYGMAETTVMASAKRGLCVDRIQDAPRNIGSTARPATGAGAATLTVNLGAPTVPGARFRVVDDAGAVLGERRVGHLQLTSPCLLDGYLESPDGIRAPFVDGWLPTGDVGYLAGGEFHFVARSKDLIVVAGRKIAPADVEHAVARKLGLRQGRVASFGFTRDATESIVIVLESRDADVAGLQRGARDACFEQCAIAPCAVLVMPVGTIPKTSSGKVQRDALRRALAPTLAPPPMRAAGE